MAECYLCGEKYCNDLLPMYGNYCSKEHLRISKEVNLVLQSIALGSKYDIND